MGAGETAASLSELLPVSLTLTGALLIGVSGLPGLLLRRGARLGERIAALLHVGGAATALVGTVAALCAAAPPAVTLAWGLPTGAFRIAIDGLSAAFLVPLLIVPALGSIYGLRYWSEQDHPESGRKLRAFYGFLAASLAMITIARDGVLFLFAWEGMALSAFFLITTDHGDPEARAAGRIYFVATHVGTLALFGMFSLLFAVTGSFGLDALPEGSAGACAAIFALGLLGFGLKAGVMPLHVWLPGAHAVAPSHVSAVLSAVVLKTGVYGIARLACMLPNPPALAGGLLLALGVVSGVAGVLFAIAQHDLKRLLAYHSIENIGIIFMGLGLALLGRALGRPEWVALGLGGAILHVWNHSFFKSLLFFSAGAVIHRLHTREIDRMGGLARTMPVTAAAFLCGAVAICGLPPLNGFVSELLVYLGLFQTLHPGGGNAAAAAAFAIPALASIGALAAACFVKAFGAVFLGVARRPYDGAIGEAPRLMLAPMVTLAALCVAIGALPAVAVPFLDRAAAAWTTGAAGVAATAAAAPPLLSLAPLAPLQWISVLAAALWLAALAAILLVRRRMRVRDAERVVTWDCGYAAPSARMQYTSSSFAEMLVAIFRRVLHPREHAPRVRELFPRAARHQSHVDDVVLDEWIVPSLRWCARKLLLLRFLQAGRIQLYILYLLLAVIALALSTLPVGDLLKNLVAR
jgi:hydrogenase-4 component B